jgi:hypothetical protein
VGSVLLDFSAAFNIIYHNLLWKKMLVKFGVPQGSSLGSLLFSIFTNYLPLVLSKGCVSMYANDSTLTTVSEITATLNKELQSVLEWVSQNKLVFNISNTKNSGVVGSLVVRALCQ